MGILKTSLKNYIINAIKECCVSVENGSIVVRINTLLKHLHNVIIGGVAYKATNNTVELPLTDNNLKNAINRPIRLQLCIGRKKISVEVPTSITKYCGEIITIDGKSYRKQDNEIVKVFSIEASDNELDVKYELIPQSTKQVQFVLVDEAYNKCNLVEKSEEDSVTIFAICDEKWLSIIAEKYIQKPKGINLSY